MRRKQSLKNEVPACPDELDEEMRIFLSKKKVSQEKITEFQFLRRMISDNLSQVEYGFNPFFTELLINKLTQKTDNHIAIDISYVLSHFLKKIMISALLVIMFLTVYTYLTHGSISELFVINPEKLNDSKFISSILFDY